MPDNDETPPIIEKFDFSTLPNNTLIHDRRSGGERRDQPVRATHDPIDDILPKKAPERRARKERRRRIDPTTFEKQYTDGEIEFMTAIQQFKTQTGKSFPSYGEVLRIASSLGYRKSYEIDDEIETEIIESDSEEATSRDEISCLPF